MHNRKPSFHVSGLERAPLRERHGVMRCEMFSSQPPPACNVPTVCRVLFRPKTSAHGQQRCADHPACGVGGEVIPACIAAWQGCLMPFIDQAQNNRAANGQRQHAPPAQAAHDGEHAAKTGENNHMRKLVPRTWHQPHCERLRAKKEQGRGDSCGQQCGNNAKYLDRKHIHEQN